MGKTGADPSNINGKILAKSKMHTGATGMVPGVRTSGAKTLGPRITRPSRPNDNKLRAQDLKMTATKGGKGHKGAGRQAFF